MTTQSEQVLEKGLIRTLQENGYEYVRLHEEENLYANFKSQLEKHNKKQLVSCGREHFTDKEFEKIRIHLEGGTRFEKAKKLRDLYPLELESGERIWVEFLNKNKWCQNEFQVSNQITVEGRQKCRYDVTILINGLPLVQIELKKRGVELKQAYNQIQRYHKTSFSGLFDYIQLFVISNGVNTRYFANNQNSGYNFTFNWTDAENKPFNDLNMFANFFLEKCNLGKMISKYIVLHEGDKCLMALRPYQFYAVEQILNCIRNFDKNGYVWHTTGAGKTLTSFKAAQLASEIDDVDKVLFVVDRHDLDTQTQSEYEAFEPGAVDSTDNTRELIRRLSGDSKIIITTIQKLNTAIKKDYYNKHLQKARSQKVVMIFDECHRSHFGECHKNIVNFFGNLRIFGFTGTPIFTENSKQERTTAEVFGDCLHRYLIKDAIADENVLGFLVEYYKGKDESVPDYTNEARMKEIAKFILANFNKSTFDGEFNALFATQSVAMLIQYYKIFKELQPKIKIGAVFTYTANSSQDDELTGMNQGFVTEKVTSDELQCIIDDYNDAFGTAFSTENFSAYYDDINMRMKKKPGMAALDLLLVVNMFLTGFDAKKLNTLYVDKNLEYHGLLQAFSRTNRILNEKKRFGKIVCFRDLKSNVEDSVRLFSNNNPSAHFIKPPFVEVKKELNELSQKFKDKYPDITSVDELKSEYDKRDFVLAFREIIRKRAEIQIYEDFDEDDEDFVMTAQEFMDFRSKYLDIAVGNVSEDENIASEPEIPYGDSKSLDDIDFCLELLHSDIINVAYILELISDLTPSSDDYQARRQDILDTMIKDSVMRKKAKLIDGFIRQSIDDNKEGFERAKADGSMDLESRLNEYVNQERQRAVEKLAADEDVSLEPLTKFLDEYDYLQREKPEIIQETIKKKKVKLKERKTIQNRILKGLREIINQFNWE